MSLRLVSVVIQCYNDGESTSGREELDGKQSVKGNGSAAGGGKAGLSHGT